METFKIVQVTHTYPPYVTGLAHVAEMVSKNLVKQGHEVEVVTLDPSLKLKKNEDDDGVYVRRFSCLAPSNTYFFPDPKVALYLRDVKADLLHAHNIGALLVPFCWLATKSRLEKVPFVLSPHHHFAGSTWHTTMFWMPYKPVAKLAVRSANVVHCVSEFEAKLVKDEFGVMPVVVSNGVDDDVFSFRCNPNKDRLILTYAGRVEKYKRVNLLVEAASNLLTRGYDVTLRIIGYGSDLSNVLLLSKLKSVKVEHYNFLYRHDYLKLLSESSCFVNLSLYEAFSIVVAEAACIGMPVVASLPWGKTFSGFPNVLLTKSDSPSEVADALLKAVNLPIGNDSRILSWPEITRKIVRQVYVPSFCVPSLAKVSSI